MMDIKPWFDENEKPLEHLVSDGGFTGIFRNIASIGDSLSSGEFQIVNQEGNNEYYDMYDYSWGQYLARMSGCTCYNISRGGMRTNWFLESFGEEQNYLETCKKCEAVIIALGVNDISSILSEKMEFGFAEGDDPAVAFAEGKQDFAGWYAQIIRNIIKINPYVHFFLMTAPADSKDEKRLEKKRLLQKMIYALADFFPRTHVLDFMEYAPPYDEFFRQKFYMNGHLNPAGYLLTAKMVASYIDYIIRHNMDDFMQLGFTHSDIKCVNYKK